MITKQKLINVIGGLTLALYFIASTACGQDEAETSPVDSTPQASEAGAVSTLPTAPNFTLPAANKGTDISLSQFQGDQPVVLVFYRAYW